MLYQQTSVGLGYGWLNLTTQVSVGLFPEPYSLKYTSDYLVL
jgi:hypothetical protein